MNDLDNEKRRTVLKWGVTAAAVPLVRYAAASGPARAGNIDATDNTHVPQPAKVPVLAPLQLNYNQPAAEKNILFEGLPVGNGRMGALIGGAPEREALYLNEITLWSGRKDAVDPQYTTSGMGAYMTAGKLYIDLPDHTQASDYTRSLDLSTALARVQYVINGKTYQREVFCSYPDNVLIVRLHSNGGSYDGTISLVDGQRQTITGQDGMLFAAGKIEGSGERYATRVLVVPESGTVSFDITRSVLTLQGCPALMLVIAMRTNYTGIEADGYLSASDPSIQANTDVLAARNKSYQALLDSHLRDHSALFGRFALDLGPSTEAQRAMTIPARLKARADAPSTPDPELEALYVQFGRYLVIASSRGPVPANLQGLWCIENASSSNWMSDYHTDINVEMNYWLADRAGLPECQKPFADYVLSQWPSWKRSTITHFNDPSNINYSNSSGKVAGWTIAFSTSIYGGIGWDWCPAANAWYCRTLWNHYQYTLDRDYLTSIYPILKSACEFWQARLIVDPASGQLVDDRDWSPEHGHAREIGITFAQELVWDLFTNYLMASATLGLDPNFAQTISRLREQLYLPKISPTTGELQEWMEDKTDAGDPQHRHLSPLVGWFEGERISRHNDPALIEGVKKLLMARGTDSFGWGLAWRIACWAKFGEADICYAMVQKLLRFANGQDGTNGTFSNMFDAYGGKLFQIDANFGGPAAILEMLAQSTMDEIVLLPALPQQWKTGSIKGLRAKGGFSIDLTWKDGALTSTVLTSIGGTTTKATYGSINRTVTLPKFGSITLDGNLNPV